MSMAHFLRRASGHPQSRHISITSLPHELDRALVPWAYGTFKGQRMPGQEAESVSHEFPPKKDVYLTGLDPK